MSSFKAHRQGLGAMVVPATPRASPGRPKDAAKRAAIVEAARQMFFAKGLEAASIEAIAASAGVSRMTVYGHFGDKQALFSEVIAVQAAQLAEALARLTPNANAMDVHGLETIRAGLAAFGVDVVVFFTDPQTAAFQRLMQVEAPRNPELAAAFVKQGPRSVLQHLAKALRGAAAGGHIVIQDPQQSAQMLIGLFRSIETSSFALGLSPGPSRPSIERHVARCVDFFLRAVSVRW